jgi:hypothetical protein
MMHGDSSYWLCIWLLWLSEYILVVIVIVIWLLSLLYHLSLSYFIDHVISYLLITPLTDEVGLAEYVCTHLFIIVFLAADSNYMPDNFE